MKSQKQSRWTAIARWLDGLLDNRTADSAATDSKVLLYINLPQDLELLLPIAKRLESTGYQPSVVISSKAWKKSPQIRYRLQNGHFTETSVVSHKAVVAGFQPSLQGIKAVITASESTAPAHKGPHALVKRANRRGIATYTLQHGLENVGLTYFDAEYPVGKVMFASKTIFIWGAIAQLPEEIPAATQTKCVSVGCPKVIHSPESNVQSNIQIPGHEKEKRLVVVFENLHWSRYSDRYRQQFLQDLSKTAIACSKTTFVVKPHPTGLWLTQNKPDKLPKTENLVIADPQDPKWKAVTASTLIELADIVITTPSTIALDAAKTGCPVAVAAYDLSLPNFEPLPLLRQLSHWQALINEQKQLCLTQKSKQFASSRLVPGSAVERIVKKIAVDLKIDLQK